MKKTVTILATLTILALAAAMPAVAKEAGSASGATGARLEPSQTTTVVRATGVIRRSVNVSPYTNYRIRDNRTGRLYALTSSRYPALLERYVGKRVAVCGTREQRGPKDFGPPLLDVFRVVPLARSSSA